MKRYPGIRPFRTEEKDLFFGRDTDIERLHRLIDLEQLVILYGRSGYGKSSLLSAGIYPRLQESGARQYFEVRFGPCKQGESKEPSQAVLAAIRRASGAGVPGEESIWKALKSLQLQGRPACLLVFDQFEELFSYPPEQILEFKKQLSEALHARVPKRYETAFASARLSPEQEDALYEPFDLKVLFSIRSDRMSLLNGLKDYLPNLLQHAYELDALDESAAAEAVKRPAALAQPEGPFDTPPFGYAPATLAAVFAALRDDKGRVETSALQIVCRYVEDYVVDGRTGQTVHPADLGDIKGIFRAFYERTIAGLPGAEQDPARRLVEDLLIKDGLRMPYAAQALLAEKGVTQSLLDRLAADSLLRVERDERGRMIYEVGHDTLIAPISEAAQARRAEAEKARLQAEADEQRREKEKAQAARRRARLIAAGAVVLSVVALLASGLAFFQWRAAEKSAEDAYKKQMLADSLYKEADKQTGLAKIARDTARQRELDARAAQERADETLVLANHNAVTAVEVLLQQANTSIYHLGYGDALITLNAAAKLGQNKPAIAKGLFELAFFFTEADSLFRARNIGESVAGLLNKPYTNARTADAMRRWLERMSPAWYGEMMGRYFPVMVDIKGGVFTPGCIVPDDCAGDSLPYRVRLSDYKLAQTETTFWQWGLYSASRRWKIKDFSPSWGVDGDNPVVNVDWYHAVEYANWLSARFGKPQVYAIDSSDTKRYNWVVDTIPGAVRRGGFCLPTEAEWEYAARGGARQYPFHYAGGQEGDLDEVAWWVGNSDTGDGVRRTRPVKTRRALEIDNKAKLYDMTGNVLEWCWDWDYAYPENTSEPVLNPSGPSGGVYRVLRGGSWRYDVTDCRLSLRNWDAPFDWKVYWGFRLARH